MLLFVLHLFSFHVIRLFTRWSRVQDAKKYQSSDLQASKLYSDFINSLVL